VKKAQVSFEDLGFLILAHPQITITQAVFIACTKNNTAIIHCDQSHMPSGLTLPICGHSLHSKIIRSQSNIKPVRQKQLWQQIVKRKIAEQSETLKRLDKNHKPIQALIEKVRSGDSSNVEAQAAQRYWKILVDSKFRRDPNAEGLNMQLNYGYAVLRAMIARALVITGFHPSLGLNHSNQYNSYCLADDVMEPFRPWVDEITVKQTEFELNKKTKIPYLELLAQRVKFQQKNMPFMVGVGRMTALLKKSYEDRKIYLSFPERC